MHQETYMQCHALKSSTTLKRADIAMSDGKACQGIHTIMQNETFSMFCNDVNVWHDSLQSYVKVYIL